MRFNNSNSLWALLAALQGGVTALTIAEINGNKFRSPYAGQTLTNITGLVTAKGPDGVWIRSTTPDKDIRTSNSIFVYSSSVGSNLTVGDTILLDAKVTEYRSANTYLYLKELGSPKNLKIISSGGAVVPLIIGQDTLQPPTTQYTELDGGDIYALPNAVANISAINPVLSPTKYGLDFWESIMGELVTIRNPRVIGRPNSYRDTWVVGDWPVSGKSKHGGLTMTSIDSNPEAIVIGTPLDGTKNPTQSKIGDLAEDITGVVYQAFGFYRILPTTGIRISSNASATYPPTRLRSKCTCRGITVGDYNVENMAPNSKHISDVAAHIANYMKTPDLLFIQEIQDNTGSKDDGVVDANMTLSQLTTAINDASNVTYEFIEIVPVNDQDGGEPGGNIRTAYLYRPEVVSLWKPNPGSSTDANEVFPGPQLKYNPGRIDPSNEVWNSTRKPLAAAWIAKGGKKPFFTINVHLSSKGGSTSLHGDVRPPINGVVEPRVKQAEITANFIRQLLSEDPKAGIIAAGDFNEFTFVQPMKRFSQISGLTDLDEVVDIPPNERYTYTFDMNVQQLDHIYVSEGVVHVGNKPQYEHIHVNSWASATDVVSDHDPSVGLFDLCGWGAPNRGAGGSKL